MNLAEITTKAIGIVKTTGDFLKQESLKFSDRDIEEKGRHNLVTYVDREAENLIVKGLSQIIPGAGFIAEEDETRQTGRDFNWIIDPIDGTTNYIHHIPLYSISVALSHHGETVMGIVYEVSREECFYTWEGGPSYLNGKRISVSKTGTLDHSLIATGFPYQDYSLMEPYLALFDDLMRNSRGIRRLGSAAVDLAYVACGRFEIFYEYGLHLWDIAAGALLVQNAGGRVTDFRGEGNFAEQRQMVSSNGRTHTEFMNMLGRHFKFSF